MTDSILTVVLPDIGEGVVEGEVIAWLKQEGDIVKQDEPVVVVMTDKATVELPAPQPGTIGKHYYKIGEIAIRDKPLYDIEIGTGFTSKKSTAENHHASLASPVVRKLAQEQGLDLTHIQGTGPEGRILKEDLKPIQDEIPLAGIQLLMAESMAQSKKEIPHFTFFAYADMTRLLALKNKMKIEGEKEGIHLTITPFFLRALSLTIKEFPLFNSTLDHEHKKIITHPEHNLGIAMAGPYGLIVPVLKKCETLTLHELIRQYEELKKRAKNNTLASSDFSGGTLTFTNFGALSSSTHGGTPIIYPSQAAIAGVARIRKEPVVLNDQVVIRDRVSLSFSFDHRIIDGQKAGQITDHFVNLLENPIQIL